MRNSPNIFGTLAREGLCDATADMFRKSHYKRPGVYFNAYATKEEH